MKVVNNIEEIKKLLDWHRYNRQKIALVPTMGTLHDGHISLINIAKKNAEIVVVSIFVNKTQFNDINDYNKYPRQIDDDLRKLKDAGVDYVFTPDENQIYPYPADFIISPQNLAKSLCGASRPRHFDGVALIIIKLFNIISPQVAIFGQKDFQQLRIIKKLVADLNFAIEILDVPIMREISGLAMSSRNKRLNPAELIMAGEIFRILNEIKKNFRIDSKILEKKQQKLLAIGFKKVEYLEIRCEENLDKIIDFQINQPARIFIAVYLGEVRLIDNLKII